MLLSYLLDVAVCVMLFSGISSVSAHLAFSLTPELWFTMFCISPFVFGFWHVFSDRYLAHN